MAARRGVRLTRSGGTVTAGHYVTTPSGVTITHSGRTSLPDQIVAGGAFTAGSGILAGTTITAGTTIAAGTDIQVGAKIDLGSGTFLKYAYGDEPLTPSKDTSGGTSLSAGTITISTSSVTILGLFFTVQQPKGVTPGNSHSISRISWDRHQITTGATINLSWYNNAVGTFAPVTGAHIAALSGNTVHWFAMGT